MQYVSFEKDRKYDLIAVGRIAIDFNPLDYFKPLSESQQYRKYLGGSPANVAVGLARLGKKVGFIGKVSDDQFGDYVTDFFAKENIDVSRVKRAKNGEKLGLTFTEILSPTESSILMYRDGIADLALEPSEVDEEYIASAKALLISGTALAQSPSREACLKAVQLAVKNGAFRHPGIEYGADGTPQLLPRAGREVFSGAAFYYALVVFHQHFQVIHRKFGVLLDMFCFFQFVDFRFERIVLAFGGSHTHHHIAVHLDETAVGVHAKRALPDFQPAVARHRRSNRGSIPCPSFPAWTRVHLNVRIPSGGKPRLWNRIWHS